MKHFLGSRFTGLLDTLHHNRRGGTPGHNRPDDILNTIENVVDGTDSKIRLVPGYQKKLREPVQSSLEYSRTLVNQIPGAIEVSKHNFTSDPCVNAFFTGVHDLQKIFSQSSEIQDFMENISCDDTHCYALLCMRMTEKTTLGMELSGNMLKRDALQVAVSFSDHRIYSPAPSEQETREGLRNCLFQGLVTNALERVVKLRLDSHRLQDRYHMLHARLRHHTLQAGKTPRDACRGNEIAQHIEETRQALKKVEMQLLKTPLLTPQVLLEQVIDVFSKPDNFVRIRKCQLRLNKMCIKISDDSPEPANRLQLTEAIIGNALPRIVTRVKFPKKELLARTSFSAFHHSG